MILWKKPKHIEEFIIIADYTYKKEKVFWKKYAENNKLMSKNFLKISQK